MTPEQRKELAAQGITVTTNEDLDFMRQLRKDYLESKIKKTPKK